MIEKLLKQNFNIKKFKSLSLNNKYLYITFESTESISLEDLKSILNIQIFEFQLKDKKYNLIISYN